MWKSFWSQIIAEDWLIFPIVFLFLSLSFSSHHFSLLVFSFKEKWPLIAYIDMHLKLNLFGHIAICLSLFLLWIISQKVDQGQEAEEEKKTNLSKGAEKRYLSKRSVTIIQILTTLITSISKSSYYLWMELKSYTSTADHHS